MVASKVDFCYNAIIMKKNVSQLTESSHAVLTKMQRDEAFWKEFGYPACSITPANLECDSLYEPFDEDIPFKEGRLFGRWSSAGW